jgi:hypothetical protein
VGLESVGGMNPCGGAELTLLYGAPNRTQYEEAEPPLISFERLSTSRRRRITI